MDWTAIAAILAGIVLITNAAVALYKWVAPAIKAKKTMEEHEERLKKIEEHEKQDLETLKEIKVYQRSQTKAVLSIVNHMLDGNGVEKLKESREDLTELLLK